MPIRESNSYQPLKESDLEVTTQRGHGKGGQHQNKTDSAVRMKHLPTKLSVFINGRDQHSNRREALKILTAKVNEMRSSEVRDSFTDMKSKLMGEGNRGDKVRTYNFMESRVVDHRTGNKTSNVKAVMKGDLSLVLPN